MQNFLKRFKLSFSRYRHGKGFGIHSPFAYRFITEVLRQPYAYYSYGALKDRRLRLVVRLTAYFRPATVVAKDEALRQAVTATSAKVRFVGEDADMIVTDAAGAMVESTARIICEGRTHTVIIGKGAANALRRLLPELKYGMTFSNGSDCAVVAAYSHLPRQDFQVRF